MALLYRWGLTVSRVQSRYEETVFTAKSSGVTGTHLIYLGRTKGQYILTYFYKPFSALFLPKNFGQLSLKAVYVIMVWKNIEI